MARAKKIDPVLFAQFISNLNQTKENTKERGKLIREFATLIGVSLPTLHAKIKAATKEGFSIVDIAKATKTRKRRKSETQIQQERKDVIAVLACKRIAGKNTKYENATEQAIMLAENTKQIPKGKYSRATMDRLIRMYGANQKTQKIGMPFVWLKAKKVNHAWQMDMTPMNQYFMRIDKTPIRKQDINLPVQLRNVPINDRHLDDYLRENNLYKIWVATVVDMFSGSFISLPFAPEPRPGHRVGGENSFDYLELLKLTFLSKNNLPNLIGRPHPFRKLSLEGKPDVIYTDNSSALKSHLVNNFLSRLDIRHEYHKPLVPNPTGKVEARQGANKRSFEGLLIRNMVKSMDEIRYFYAAWTYHINKIKGLQQAYHQNMLINPITQINEENIFDALEVGLTCHVYNDGTIRHQNESYYVDINLIGQKITLYKAPLREQKWIVEDSEGRTYFPQKDGALFVNFGEEFKRHKKLEGQSMLEAADAMADQLKDRLILDDVLPPTIEDAIIPMPSKKEELETRSHFVPTKIKSLQKAINIILIHTGYMPNEDDTLWLKIQARLEEILQIYGVIEGAALESLIQILNTDDSKFKEKRDVK